MAQNFKQSLADLMSEMSASNPHFVRCLKPNLEKVKNSFKIDLMERQLRYTGMLETTRIRKEGYAHRPTFQDFLNRYKVIGFPMNATPTPNASSVTRIIAKAGLEDWQVGRTKVFLRYYHPGMLARKSQIINQNGLQATSGFEVCLAIGSQHLWCWGQSTSRIQIL